MNKPWIIYGSELSPFTLKVIACFEYHRIPYRFLFEEGNTWENIKIQVRKEALVKGVIPLTWPQMDEDDEFPLVPYVFGPDKQNLYDSTAIAEWIELNQLGTPRESLLNHHNPAIDFVIRLIDDYADDYGLYMVHHNRWKVSAKTNNAGKRLARELRTIVGPAQPIVANNFSVRQIERLPYLFSVAPEGFHIEGLKSKKQPPSHLDFPPTHQLLEQSFENLLLACESILKQQPYLLGDRFTLADASLYGQLGMNMKDPTAAARIQDLAPITYKWISRISDGQFESHDSGNDIELKNNIKPLLAEICRTYVPLMNQNLDAYNQLKKQGNHLFNEKAFDNNKAIYAGEIDGTPFKSVAKSFQAKTWRQLKNRWNNLSDQEKQLVSDFLPEKHEL
jgi:glutathione S-transferase